MTPTIYREDGSHLPKPVLSHEVRCHLVEQKVELEEAMRITGAESDKDPYAVARYLDSAHAELCKAREHIINKLEEDDEVRAVADNMLCVRLVREGRDVDLVVVDPYTGEMVHCGRIVGLSKLTPLEGVRLRRFYYCSADCIDKDENSRIKLVN